jgi:hypothetical protein
MDRLQFISEETKGVLNLVGKLVLKIEKFEDELDVIGCIKGQYPHYDADHPYRGGVVCQDQDDNFIYVTTDMDGYSLIVKPYDGLGIVKSVLQSKLDELTDLTKKLIPQKGDTADTCHKVALVCALNDLEATLNGLGDDDLIPCDDYESYNAQHGYEGFAADVLNQAKQ